MAADEQLEKWYFTKEQLANTPSQKCGYDADKELSCRQQAANFIQDMGQRLQVAQLCINTAIVYMHRFYMFHSFSRFHRTAIAASALFLAAKVEEQPRKLEHVIKVAQICLHREQPPPDIKSEIYMEQAQELVVNENILLQTLGFDVAIDHPHTHVVRCCHLVRASKDLAQTSYFMASNSLHLTTMCLQYKPTVVACFCIHLACKWSDWEIPQSNEGKPWFYYIDKTVTQELLEQLTEEFLIIFDKCPSRLKKKIMSLSSSQNQTILSAFGREDKKRNGEGSNSSMAGGSGLSVEDLKKKQEYQRHHADYKKHHMSHRESHSLPSKSTCLFAPPQKTQPPSSGSSHISQSRLMGKPSIPLQPQQPSAIHPQPSSQADMPGVGKPEHLHHRPRRPDEKHARNHESLRDPYKKYENKLTGATLSEFSQNNGGSASTKSAASISNSNSLSGVLSAGFPVEPSVAHSLTEPVTVKNELVVAPAALAMSKMLQQSVAPHKPKTPPQTQSLPTVKTERSIFSPEKSTPPSVDSRPPPTGLKRKRSTSSESDMLLPKTEPPSHFDLETLVPKEEKPNQAIEKFPSSSPAVEQSNQPFHQPFLPQPEQSAIDKDCSKEQKKKKKRHREHKEKHKDKHKHKHRNREPEPIVITIPKEKLTLPQQPEQGLKLKIPREKLTGVPASSVAQTAMPTGLKLKISQGKIKESRKREKIEEERSPPTQGLPRKYLRPNGTTLQVGMDQAGRR